MDAIACLALVVISQAVVIGLLFFKRPLQVPCNCKKLRKECDDLFLTASARAQRIQAQDATIEQLRRQIREAHSQLYDANHRASQLRENQLTDRSIYVQMWTPIS